MSGSQCESQSQAREQQEQGLQGWGHWQAGKTKGSMKEGCVRAAVKGVCERQGERRKRLAPSILEDRLHPAGWLGQLPRRQP